METNTEQQESAPIVGLWPVPTNWPLYVPVSQAAEIAGVSYELMRKWVDAVGDHIPYIQAGRNKKLVRVAAIPEYLMKKESL